MDHAAVWYVDCHRLPVGFHRDNDQSGTLLMEKKITFPPWERPLFLMLITLVGGYMNAYTYMTRDGILANMHTVTYWYNF